MQVGSTFEEIADAVGPGFEIADAGTLGEGLGGYSVSLEGEVLFYFGSYQSDEIFELLIVGNPRLGLASGLRPGMTLAEAVEDEALFITNEYDPAGTIKLITITCFGPGRQSCQS